jgi:hypothetical protein
MQNERLRGTRDLTLDVTSWKAEPGWLILLPSRLSDRIGEIILPESYTKKRNSGICIQENVVPKTYLDKECFFPTHSEYQIIDTDTGYMLYIVEANKVILTRDPPEDVLAASRERPGDNLAFHTLERSA